MAAIAFSTVSFLWAWRTTKPVHMADDFLDDRTSEDIVLEVPSSRDMLVAANNHAHSLYGHDYLTLMEYERWWGRNQWILAALKSKTGQYLGYFDVLPLTAEGVKLIESGKYGEKDIGPEYILPPERMKAAKKLYLAGIAVKDAGTEEGKSRTARLLLGMLTYMKHYYGDSPRHVIAIGATKDGTRILESINAKIICTSEGRLDKHNLYEFVSSPELLASVRARAKRRGGSPRLSLKTPR